MKLGATAILATAWLALGVAVWLQTPPPGEPGLYYDEAFLAEQARDFVAPEHASVHPPGTRSIRIAGRPFPLRNAAYLGSLKSQLLIPSLALFGATTTVVRTTTLVTALLGAFFFLLFAREVLDLRTALVASLLVAFDPSFVFFGALEWGPFTTLLLCRGLGLWALVRGWRDRRTGLLALGGFALGLGVYARADFAVVLFAFAIAATVAGGSAFRRELLARTREIAWAAGAFVLGASPMLLALAEVLQTSAGIADRGDLGYKARVLWSTLDGSHFERVIAAGGRFEDLFALDAPASLFGAAVLASAAWLAAVQLRAARAGRERDRARLFVLLAAGLLAFGMWLVPGAVRAHHALNLLPLPHLLVACALAPALGASPRLRVAAGLALALLVASELRVTASTRALIASTGGRGRFSNALDAFAAELSRAPGARAVALDWGFHEPLRFLAPATPSSEPIWQIPRQLLQGRAWSHAGDASDYYLVRDAPYDLFQLGPKLLARARRIEAEEPARVEIRRHDDRQGDAAFYSVRFTAPHVLVYGGEFQVHFR